jgi:hypothetical protein
VTRLEVSSNCDRNKGIVGRKTKAIKNKESKLPVNSVKVRSSH